MFLGETLTLARAIGAVIVIAGVGFVIIEKRPRHRMFPATLPDPLPAAQIAKDTQVARIPEIMIGIGLLLLLGSAVVLLAA